MSRAPQPAGRIDDYLAERRRQGFHLRSRDAFLSGFARFVEAKHHHGPLTAEIMVEWVRAGKDGRWTTGHLGAQLETAAALHLLSAAIRAGDRGSRGVALRPGTRTRCAPHIYREDEIDDLLAAARRLGPAGSLRPATYETLFGLMASTGVRVSEAIHLRDADVDLKQRMLTDAADQVRQVAPTADPSQHGQGAGALPEAAANGIFRQRQACRS